MPSIAKSLGEVSNWKGSYGLECYMGKRCGDINFTNMQSEIAIQLDEG